MKILNVKTVLVLTTITIFLWLGFRENFDKTHPHIRDVVASQDELTLVNDENSLETRALSQTEADEKVYLSCENLLIIQTEDGFIIKNKDNNIIITHDEIYISFRIGPQTTNSKKRCDAPISVTNQKKYGLVMTDGTLFAGKLFENISALHKNVLGFAENKKWGLIDKSGRVIVNPQYDDITWYGAGKFIVDIRKDSAFLIDAKGRRSELADDPNYFVKYKQHLPPREAYLSCPDGSSLAVRGGKWGIVGQSGEILISFKYPALKCMYGEAAMAAIDELKLWCPVAGNGLTKNKERCTKEHYETLMSHHWPEKLSEDNYESSVLWNKTYLEYGAGLSAEPPKYMPDGVMGHRIILATPFSSYWYEH